MIRERAPLSLALAALLCAAVSVPDRADAATRPNIVFLLIDDLRWDAIGCNGDRVARTPEIDRLAQHGVNFRHMFCTTSICSTSRASILTGQHGARHGIIDFRAALTPEVFANTFAGRLRANGYRTAFIGKWGLGGQLPKSQYDHFRGFSGQGRYFQRGREGHLTSILRSQAVEFVDGVPTDKPFCLQLSFKSVHCQDGDPWPFQPDPKYASLFEEIAVPTVPTATEKVFDALPPFVRESEARRRWKIRFATPAMYQKSMKDYYRLISGVDETLGALRAALAAKGLADNTVIALTSDNGFYLGDRGLAGKWFVHEESIRLPLIVFDPRLDAAKRGRVLTQMALTIDLAPTFLDLAGIDAPQAMQGRSLVPLLRGEDAGWRDAWFYQHIFRHRTIPKTEGIRTDRWKYVRWVEIPREGGAHPAARQDAGKAGADQRVAEPFEELYDLENDPHELRNLAERPDHAADLERLRELWRDLGEKAR